MISMRLLYFACPVPVSLLWGLPADRLIIGDYRHVDVSEQLAGGSLDLSDPEVVLETGKTSHLSILPLQLRIYPQAEPLLRQLSPAMRDDNRDHGDDCDRAEPDPYVCVNPDEGPLERAADGRSAHWGVRAPASGDDRGEQNRDHHGGGHSHPDRGGGGSLTVRHNANVSIHMLGSSNRDESVTHNFRCRPLVDRRRGRSQLARNKRRQRG